MTQSNGARLKHGIDDYGKQLWELNKSMHKSTQILEHKVYEELFSSQVSMLEMFASTFEACVEVLRQVVSICRKAIVKKGYGHST